MLSPRARSGSAVFSPREELCRLPEECLRLEPMETPYRVELSPALTAQTQALWNELSETASRREQRSRRL